MANLRGGTMIGGALAITTTNLLDAILKVDGSGSGIDADLLDGYDSTHFSPFDHNHDDRYINADGDTMTGILKIPIGGDKGVQYGSVLTNTTGQNLVITNASDGIRFSDSGTWGYDFWAGLKYESEPGNVFLGGPKGSRFANNGKGKLVSVYMDTENAGVGTVYANTISLKGMLFCAQTGFGTGIQIGDDSQIADCNRTNMFNVIGVQNPTAGGIIFGNGLNTNIYRSTDPNDSRLVTDSVFNAQGLQIKGVNLDDKYVNSSGDKMTGQLIMYDNNSSTSGVIRILAPNSPQGAESFRGIEIYHADAGKVMIGGKRGGSYDDYFVVKTTNGSGALIDALTVSSSSNVFNYLGNRVWHEGNDGASSGLDADLFDGIDSSNFVYGTNIAATNQVDDFNTLWKSGFYNSNNQNNTPTQSPWHWLLNVGHVSNKPGYMYGFQLSSPVDGNKLFFRNRDVNGRGDWGRVYTTNDKPMPIEIGALPLVGGTMTGDIVINSSNAEAANAICITANKSTGGWAQGLYYSTLSKKGVAGIGLYCDGQTEKYLYLGVNSSSWQSGTGLAVYNDRVTFKDRTVWHAGNDGSGSGLDADLLDGLDSSSFVKVAGGTMNGDLNMNSSWINFNTNNTGLNWSFNTDYAKIYFKDDSDGDTTAALTFETGDNGDEGFNFRRNNGGTYQDLLKIYNTGVTANVPIYNAVFNDYAEYFEKGDEVEPGDIVMLNPDSEDEEYIKSNSAYSSLAVGICSDEFAQCIGGERVKDNSDKFIAVGLAGRLRVKITGKAKKGDLITTSDIEGVGMVAKEYKPGTIIGKCLENKNTDSIERVRVLIVQM